MNRILPLALATAAFALPIATAATAGDCDLTLVVPGPTAVIGSNVEARPTLTPPGRSRSSTPRA